MNSFLDKRSLLAIFAAAISFSAIGEDCSSLAIYYGNGIGFDNESVILAAIKSRNRLEQEYQSKAPKSVAYKATFKLAYNPSDGLVLDALEAVREQLGDEYPALAIALILRITDLTPILTELRATLTAKQIQAFNDFYGNKTITTLIQGKTSGATVDAMVNSYNKDIPGKRVVLVSHSQGNIFANLAYKRLTSLQKAFFADVPVASPESVAPASRIGHVRFVNDLVIAAVQAGRTNVGLPPPLGATDVTTYGAKTGFHGFLESYMAEPKTKAFIVDSVVNSVNLLPPVAPTCSASSTGYISYLPALFGGLVINNPACNILGTIPSTLLFASNGSVSGTQCYTDVDAPKDSPYKFSQHDDYYENTLDIYRPDFLSRPLILALTHPSGDGAVGVGTVLHSGSFAIRGVSFHVDSLARISRGLNFIRGQKCRAMIRDEPVNGDSYIDFNGVNLELKKGAVVLASGKLRTSESDSIDFQEGYVKNPGYGFGWGASGSWPYSSISLSKIGINLFNRDDPTKFQFSAGNLKIADGSFAGVSCDSKIDGK